MLKFDKAVEPTKLKPFLAKELWEDIAPIAQIIFERALQTDGQTHCHTCCQRKGTGPLHSIINLFLSLELFAWYLNKVLLI